MSIRVGGLALALTALGVPALIEAKCPEHLFVIARSKNANLVVYDAKRGPDGALAASEPVVIHWLLNGDKSKREKLSWIQRERAYGIDVSPGASHGTYAVAFKASKKRKLTLRVLNGCPVITTSIGGKDGILRKLFVQSKEGTALPKVEYVEFFGEDPAGGAPLYEKYVP